MNEKRPTDETPPNATNSDHDTANPQPHHRANAQQKPEFIPPAAPLLLGIIPLKDLKDQSALIQCPYCLRYVYTTLSDHGNYWNFIALYWLIPIFFPGLLSDKWTIILVVALFVLNHFAYTVHGCPSCSKKVAIFSKFERVINVTAPAIGIPPLVYL